MFNTPYLPGGGEDAVLGYTALSNENTRVIRGGAPIDRNSKHHMEIGSDSFIHDTNVFNRYARQYIRDTFDDQEWELLSGLTPKGIKQ